MELHTPLALDQGRRCQTLEAAQNTVEEVPHTVYCGDTERECVKRHRYNIKQYVQPMQQKKCPHTHTHT